MTRLEVQSLTAGSRIAEYFPTRNGQRLPESRMITRTVTRVYAQRDNWKGEAFVCFYTSTGTETGEISDSTTEGETRFSVLVD